MRTLFVMDPVEKLDLTWDTSLFLLAELSRRGHQNWMADLVDLAATEKGIFASAFGVRSEAASRKPRRVEPKKRRALTDFDLILIRKDPPFDAPYLALTYLLEPLAKKIPVLNDPAGIRNTNEKCSILKFPKWIPETLVTNSVREIREFQKRLKDDVVVKPLNQKGGEGVFLWKRGEDFKSKSAGEANPLPFVMAQRYLRAGRDKRILLLNGRILAAFERRAPAGDFRTNLSLGGTFHRTEITGKIGRAHV